MSEIYSNISKDDPKPDPAPRSGGNGKAVFFFIVLVFLILVASGGVLFWQHLRTQETTAHMEALKSKMEERGIEELEAHKQVQAISEMNLELERKVEELQKEYEGVVNDRENVLIQIKKAYAERDRAYIEADNAYVERDEALLVRDEITEKIKVIQIENEPLRERIAELEDKIDQLLFDQEQYEQQVVRLEDELQEAMDASGRKELQVKTLLALEEIERLKDLQKVTDSKKRILEGEKRELEIELQELRNEHLELRQQYDQELNRANSLSAQLKEVPGDLEKLAHERDFAVNDNADTHYNLGVLFADQGRYERALKEFARVLDMRPTDADSHYNLGVIYSEHLRDEGKAVFHLRRFIELKPNAEGHNWARRTIASIQAWIGEESLS